MKVMKNEKEENGAARESFFSLFMAYTVGVLL